MLREELEEVKVIVRQIVKEEIALALKGKPLKITEEDLDALRGKELREKLAAISPETEGIGEMKKKELIALLTPAQG